jgi:hypothetical protein
MVDTNMFFNGQILLYKPASKNSISTFSLEGDGTDSLSIAALPPSLEGEGWDEGNISS